MRSVVEAAGRARLIRRSEGERAAGELQNPFVREARFDGSFVSGYAVPACYGTATGGIGIRRKLAFDSLAVSRSTVYTVAENTLLQDGPASAVGGVSPSRAVPEPQEWALLPAGRGVLGWHARRRSDCRRGASPPGLSSGAAASTRRPHRPGRHRRCRPAR